MFWDSLDIHPPKCRRRYFFIELEGKSSKKIRGANQTGLESKRARRLSSYASYNDPAARRRGDEKY